jgi:integrase
MLEWSVTPTTLKRYRTHVREFVHWCIANHEEANNIAEFDELLLDYIHHLHESGLGKTKGSMTLYGILLFMPELKLELPRTSQAIKGWNKHSIGRSYPPLTWELAVAIAVQMGRSGHYRHGIAVLLGFDCFCRISELCNIERQHIADVGDKRISIEHKGMLVVLPSTKTGKNQWVEVLDKHVITLVRHLLTCTKGNILFPFTPSEFRHVFKSTCADLGLSDLYVPHSLRHGGATRYRHVLKWSVENVLERGRWVSVASARRYIQQGVAMLMAMKAPPHITDLGILMARDPVYYITLTQKH